MPDEIWVHLFAPIRPQRLTFLPSQKYEACARQREHIRGLCRQPLGYEASF